jgi:hypothetical protein
MCGVWELAPALLSSTVVEVEIPTQWGLPTLALNPLTATLMNLLASVANKRLTSRLSPLDAPLTKTGGGAGLKIKNSKRLPVLVPLYPAQQDGCFI